MVSLVKSTKLLKKKLYQPCTTSYGRQEHREYFQTHSMRPTVLYLITKSDRNITRKVSHRSISLMDTNLKNLQKKIKISAR